MTVGLVMIVRDEEPILARCLTSVLPVIDTWTVIDTGSTDRTPDLAQSLLDQLPGELHRRPWVDFGHNRTEALAIAKGSADWLLRLDADCTVEAHRNLGRWLGRDPDPDVAAWRVELRDGHLRYRRPDLVRGHLDWRYVGPTHEYLDGQGRKQRSLTGLTVHHHVDGSSREGKHERDLKLLDPGYRQREPRAVYYTAQALECLGRTDAAVAAYRLRATLRGFEEERWHAAYRAAVLTEDVPELLRVHADRPHRHEPLTAAARIVAAREHDDVLFVEEV